MGWADIFPCLSCGVRESGHDESEVLIAPSRLRAQSIQSQEGYGTMNMMRGGSPTGERLTTDQQRERMHEIGREAGSHMRQIEHLRRAPYSPFPAPAMLSATSSRATSPSPPRPESSPPNGIMQPQQRSASAGSRASSDSRSFTHDGDGVVRKTIFPDGAPGSRRASGRSTGSPSGTQGRRGRKRPKATRGASGG